MEDRKFIFLLVGLIFASMILLHVVSVYSQKKESKDT